MPFTPLHMGPGLAVKAVMQRKFSLMVFGWSQVAIDLQPLLAMTTGLVELLGFSHTLLGATLIGLLSGATGKHLGEWGLRVLREPRITCALPGVSRGGRRGVVGGGSAAGALTHGALPHRPPKVHGM